MMTDLEITKLCAEAMGLKHWPHHRLEGVTIVSDDGTGRESYIYAPLHDDAQAMALVKRFNIAVMPNYDKAWNVSANGVAVENADLNCAICECVAKMQKAQSSPA